MSAIIFFLLGALFLAICEWFYLNKFRGSDPFADESVSSSESNERLSDKASSFKASATSTASNATSKILETPAVSKGRAFLERIAAKENSEEASSDSAPEVNNPVNSGSAQKQDKTSIETTRSMTKKASVTTLNAEQSSSTPADTNKTSAASSSGKDDLQKVSGIGPKIEQLLQAEGINSYHGLAKTEISKLSQVMQKAGPRYALADVSSWPEQAKMLAHGDVGALEMLQQSLKKG